MGAGILCFLDFKVVGRNDDTVGGDFVASIQDSDVTDYNIPDVDLLHGTLFATDNSD